MENSLNRLIDLGEKALVFYALIAGIAFIFVVIAVILMVKEFKKDKFWKL